MPRAKASSRPSDVTDTSLPDPLAAPSLAGTAGAELLQLPVDAVVPSEENPRDSVPIDPDLVASIRRFGVLEPLIVSPAAPDGVAAVYPLIAGARRLAHAREAGLATVPAVVRDVTTAQAAELRLVENLQRLDLSPLEEARAFDRLINEHGYTQADVAAAISRNQGHVSKRLALLKLRAEGKTMLADGRLQLNEAISLSRLPAPVQDGVLAKIAGGLDPTLAVENAVRRVADLKVRAKVIKELEADGIEWVDRVSDRVSGAARLSYYGSLGHVDPAAHLKDDCALVVVRDAPIWTGGTSDLERWTEQYCTEPQRHTESAAKPAASPETAESNDSAPAGPSRLEEWGAKQRQTRDADARRSAHIRSVLGGKLPRSAGEHRDLWWLTGTATGYTELASEVLLPRLSEWLLPEALTESVEGVSTETAARAIADLASQPADVRSRWALALVLADGETYTHSAYLMMDPDQALHPDQHSPAAIHLTWLASTGLELDETEQRIVDTAPSLLVAFDLETADPDDAEAVAE